MLSGNERRNEISLYFRILKYSKICFFIKTVEDGGTSKKETTFIFKSHDKKTNLLNLKSAFNNQSAIQII